MVLMNRPKLGVDNNGGGIFGNIVKAGGTANRVMKSSPNMEGLVGEQYDTPPLPGTSFGANSPAPKPTSFAASNQNIRSFDNPMDTLTQGLYSKNKSAQNAMAQNMARPVEKTDLERLVEELLAQSKSGYAFDPNGQEAQMIEQIFGSQLGALNNARSSANSRFTEASADTRDLYSGHENQIRTHDAKAFQDIGNETAARTKDIYGRAVGQAQETQRATRSENEEMMQRLGLEDSAPIAADRANEQQGTIDSLLKGQAATQTRDSSHLNADLNANVQRAGSIADESVSKQSELRRQLQGILGDLDTKEADINSQKSQAMLGATQRGQQNWREDRQYATDSLAQMLEAQAKASSAEETQGSNPLALMNVMAAAGIQNPAEQQKYSNAYTEAIMKSGYTPGMDDPTAVYSNYMLQKYPDLDPNRIVQMVSSMANYGTYKPGAPAS